MSPKRSKEPPNAGRRRPVRQPPAPARSASPDSPFPIVGVGASAGGLEAFRGLLGALPANPGMAFVLVQHLDPHHGSILAELLSRTTSMPVAEVRAAVRVEPDRVYVIPPGEDIVMADGSLSLVPRTQTRGRHMPIDHFLRTLAETAGQRAIGVILSGTASDGTLGLAAIKEHGGIAFAQDPDTAAHDGMPRNAIASGLVDMVLPPEGIARELSRLGSPPYLIRRTPGESLVEATPEAEEGDSLKRVLAILLRATRADFSAYRETTVRRRIARRMTLARIEDLREYARYLEAHPDEVQALHQDCLISVTSFFREPDAFRALSDRVLPRLLEGRPLDAPIRVWVPGCATGEEVYSIAICLLESAGALSRNPSLQVFATDLSESAVHKARAGSYPKSIEEDVSPERLRRFFTSEDGRYQVSKPIRDLCVFACHNLTRDPPFSHLDLISCRNVLIYLETRVQQRVLGSFHYALNVPGFLMLGTSESASAAEELFSPVEKEHRIYAKRPTTTRLPMGFVPGVPESDKAESSAGDRSPATPRSARRSALAGQADRVLLARYAPAGVVINGGLHIVEFHGDTSPYLDHSPGQASLDLLKMARPDLAHDLRWAIQEARKTGAPVRREGVSLRSGARARRIALEAVPLDGGEDNSGNVLIIFDAAKPAQQPGDPVVTAQPREQPILKTERARLGEENARLRQELEAATQQLNAIGQEHDAASEELQSANEEALSANEELQSINEELETAKEELQSSNEELSTLNQELQDRNRQLGALNDDLMNLITSLNIPLVMLGGDLRLRRFTAAAEKIFNLIPTDVGRPLSDLRTNLEDADLEREVHQVIETVQALHREVTDRQGRSYSMRIRPYRTRENKIDGAIILLMDVDALKRALDDANAIVDTALEPMLVLDSGLRVERANRSFYETFATTPSETEGSILYEMGNRQWDNPRLRTALQEVLPRDSHFEGFEMEQDFPRVGRKTIALNARRLFYKEHGKEKILLGMEDRTDSRALALEREARRKAQEADRIKDEFMATLSHELRGPLNTMVGWVHALRASEFDEAIVGRGLAAIERAVKAQTRLVEDLLDYSRMTVGKLHLSQKLTDVATLVDNAVESLRGAAEAKEIRIEIDKGAGPTVTIGDGDRLQQVIWNLLSNALKFTPQGGRVELRVGRVGTQLQVSVRDTGQGISGEFLPHVFERFRQADAGSRRQQGGLGLGLAIVKQLVELHGGTVAADSDGESRGTTFTVKLPIPTLLVEGEEAATVGSLGIPATIARTRLQGVRVLVVEDDPDGRDMLVELLTQWGAEVKAVSAASEALEVLTGGLPDVLLSDIGLPDQDGFQLMRKVRELPSEGAARLPSLALTAYAGSDDVRKTRAAGFDAHLGKPVVPADLINAVASLAGRGAGE